jgi:hypothetical protein
MGKRDIPKLGNTVQEVVSAWKELKAYPREVVIGWFVGVGIYSWQNGCWQRNNVTRGRHGSVSTVTPATRNEVDELLEGIEQGQVQIEGRRISGALGVYNYSDAGQTQRVYHRATGRKIGL